MNIQQNIRIKHQDIKGEKTAVVLTEYCSALQSVFKKHTLKEHNQLQSMYVKENNPTRTDGVWFFLVDLKHFQTIKFMTCKIDL